MNLLPPAVVACLPSYNAAEFIKKTLRCLQDQTYPNLKVLISDDCSTDDTVKIIESIIVEDDRFHLIQQKKNLGWIENVNRLMERAVKMGEYVFIMPHDDLIAPEYVQKLTAILEQNHSNVLSFCDMKRTYLDGRSKIDQYKHLEGLNRIEQTSKLLHFEGSWSSPYRGIIRSSAVKKIIPIEKNKTGDQEFSLDWIWLIDLSLMGTFIRLPEVFYYKYYKQTSRSLQWDFNNWNYISLFLTGSFLLLRRNITITEQLRYQTIIYKIIAKRLVIWSGLYSIIKPLWVKFETLYKKI